MLTLIIFLAVLSLLVFVHEFGHFIAARRAGVTVEEFGFGFPPRLFGWKRGQTTYSVNWIPLGGFVKLKGESGEAARDPDSFAHKKVWQRAMIIAAGVLMNFFLAAVLLTVGFIRGLPHVAEELPRGARVEDVRIAIGRVLEGSPAEAARIEPGDVILAIDEQEGFITAEAVQEYVREHEGAPVRVRLARATEEVEVVATPVMLPETGRVGLGIGLFVVGTVSYPWYLAPLRGLQMTGILTVEIVRAFGHVLGGLVSEGRLAVDISGPVGIAVLTGRAAELGLSYLLQFVAILSINLGVINFVPFPALDGGRFLFLIIEKIRGRPVDRRAEAIIHQIGFALLLALVLIVTYRDLARFSDKILGGIRSLF